jgi:hypothetical protein
MVATGGRGGMKHRTRDQRERVVRVEDVGACALEDAAHPRERERIPWRGGGASHDAEPSLPEDVVAPAGVFVDDIAGPQEHALSAATTSFSPLGAAEP